MHRDADMTPQGDSASLLAGSRRVKRLAGVGAVANVGDGRDAPRSCGLLKDAPLGRVWASMSAAWLFLIAGLLLVSAAMLVPAWRDIEQVRADRDRVAAAAEVEARTLAATRAVLESLESGDASVADRLVAWQLNLLPEGDRAVAREVHAGGVLGWIDASVAPVPPPGDTAAETPLETLVSGPARLWVLGAGGLMIFGGIIGGGDRRTADPQVPGKRAGIS